MSLLRAAWLAPTTLVGHLAGLLIGLVPPRHFSGPAASAWLYEIRPNRAFDWVGAVTLGHVILHRPRFFSGEEGGLILAHELAHTRQHDALGPFYLPLHVLAQTASAVLSIGRAPRFSRVHDFNPLEQTFICLGASACHPAAFEPSEAREDAGKEGAHGAPITATSMLAAFGIPGDGWARSPSAEDDHPRAAKETPC